jgi:CubicO group peptidase (beta-lactamase class C family)
MSLQYEINAPDPAASSATEDTGTWPRWHTPEDAGWSSNRLQRAFTNAEAIGSAAVMVVQGGRVVSAWGRVATRYNVHSIRKSLLSAMIGQHEAQGRIDLEATLAQLGINDRQGLTDREKLATVLNLLTARSGVYHPSGYESDWMISIKPPRHSHGPGVNWCYNNWDFNTLGTIFTRLTDRQIHAEFAEAIAKPTGMQDFDPDRDGGLHPLPESDHPAYPFRMTARDLARFGELFLRRGRWDGQAIIPRPWVETSVLPYSDAGTGGAYGYMWWVTRDGILFPNQVMPAGSYAAKGAGGHVVLVLPSLDTIIVHRVDTDRKGHSVSSGRIGRLIGMILDARQAD